MSRAMLLLALLLGACDRGEPALESRPTDNANFDVQRLFTVDGCTAYRFVDARRYRYFVRCAPDDRVTTLNEWREPRGKSSVLVTEQIQTIGGAR